MRRSLMREVGHNPGLKGDVMLYVKEIAGDQSRVNIDGAGMATDRKMRTLGYETHGEVEKKKKSAERSARIGAWKQENWCYEHKSQRVECGCEAVPPVSKHGSVSSALGPSENEKTRNQLMDEVRRMGVKNFRVMNKAELAEIVGGAGEARVAEIMAAAVARWKAGWKKCGT